MNIKYYIKAYFGDWKEVTKEKADKFIKGILENATAIRTEEQRQECIKRHYKEVKEGE